LLYGIINKEAIFHTGNILGGLRTEIIKILKQSTKIGSHSDGMDMSIIAYNLQNKILQFSGANNPIYIVKNGALNISNSVNNLINETSMPNISNKLYEIKPDRMPISLYRKTGNFTTHELQLEDGDQIYLFSDGYADQFGGEKGKKFKYKQLKELLLTISQKTLLEQEKILNKTFKSWKGDLEQLDDVCLVGLKI